MKVLIIASGRGRRIERVFSPKPLLPLLGLSLIERIILTVKREGLKDFVIVVGYLKEKIKEKLGDGGRWGVNIEYVENKEWEKENGVSILCARSFIREKFILLMADHIFEGNILKKLLKQDLDCAGILCIDKNPGEYIDLNDATKVKLREGMVEDIGKDLEKWDAIDTGIFLLSPQIFEVLEENLSQGKTTLSEGIKALASRGVRTIDIEDNFWIDIDTEKDLKNAERILLKKTRKLTDGIVSCYLNRPLSAFFTKMLVKEDISPNAISFLSFFIALLASFFFSQGGYFFNFLGGIFTQLSSVVDGCDGEIAKLKFKESEYGAWLDTCLDRYADALIILGICLGLSRNVFLKNIWVVGFFALLGSFMNSYTAIKYDALFREKNVRPKIRIGRDLRCFLIMVGAIFGRLFFILYLLALLTNAESIRRIYVLGRRRNEKNL